MFAELMNIGQYPMWKSFLAITRQFMWECPRILTNIWYSPILRELTYVWFRLYIVLVTEIFFIGHQIDNQEKA